METENVKILSLATQSPDVILIVRVEKRETDGKPLVEKRACQKFKRTVGSHIKNRYIGTCRINSMTYFCSYWVEGRCHAILEALCRSKIGVSLLYDFLS